MSTTEWGSGKGHTDENFPVASALITKRHRPAVMAYYRFARAADDAADHPALAPAEKLAILDRLEATLRGEDELADALPLRRVLGERGMDARHATDLLGAFRQDVGKTRYASMDELMAYCALSAMPVGRYVLDVHGEDRAATWPASDALCAALQIINHVQDCGKDYREIDRVYMPDDILTRHGASVADLGASAASPALGEALREVTRTADRLLSESAKLAPSVKDSRLRMEIAVIHGLAERIVARLLRYDPLSERVHLSRTAMAAGAIGAILRESVGGTAAKLIGRR
ncbi:squalene synthase HpnC [Acuticoccus sp. M5D2P5]|uniref:squalene synthase HpnC n=1 Tax=Acuticoccus kalidii TaxID=2910977 RepID=UPI001F357E45|nr:squalene synthase HpnC [Acuticoccus kalidii]MCF3935831.1 squalene synthase HpnC [Acuticoccus kalidii]